MRSDNPPKQENLDDKITYRVTSIEELLKKIHRQRDTLSETELRDVELWLRERRLEELRLLSRHERRNSILKASFGVALALPVLVAALLSTVLDEHATVGASLLAGIAGFLGVIVANLSRSDPPTVDTTHSRDGATR